MDFNQNTLDDNIIHTEPLNDVTTGTTNGYLKDVDSTDLSGRLRPSLASISPVRPKLPFKTKFFYSLGHIYNDLTVSIWFSYTLLYFKYQFDDSMAGALILIGQFADAIASPVVGFQSDRPSDLWIFRYGRRKTWHLLGVIMNTISVPIVYNTPCFPGNCELASSWARFAWYAVLIIIFQSGWAATQVSHVSLIVDLTDDTNERIALNAYRQAATIGANICLYMVTLFVIGFGSSDTLSKKDLDVFTKVSYIVCGIGIVFSILFHVFVKEPEYTAKPRKVRPSVFTVETKRLAQASRGSTSTMTLLAQNQPDTASSGRPSICAIPEPSSVELGQYLRSKANQKRWSHWLKSFSVYAALPSGYINDAQGQGSLLSQLIVGIDCDIDCCCERSKSSTALAKRCTESYSKAVVVCSSSSSTSSPRKVVTKPYNKKRI
ncbi:unnamed protein product [Medioppia subpectinata]|uniref:Uncharacterized protein n=1 Tax=Medioppia subpectinata TaxID=1979941 RepID=A0A7R9PUX2_9ACAR|nr:unnamed protein product [Medioppia subpectinata]CAG2101691.1 unnamed protein product [Medioppia subpectinata]